MAYILDTGILVDVLRRDEGAIEFVDSLDSWGYSVISAMELVIRIVNFLRTGVREVSRSRRAIGA